MTTSTTAQRPTLDQRLAVLKGFGTAEVWARVQHLLGQIPGAEAEASDAKWGLDQATDEEAAYNALAMGLAEGKNEAERRAKVEQSKATDERWNVIQGHLEEQRVRLSAATVEVSRLHREYGALLHFLDLRAAQIRFLSD